MSIETKSIQIDHRGAALTGHLAWDGAKSGERPLVLVSHAWGGLDDFARGEAEKLAQMGYAGLALDLFGTTGSSREENQALIKPFLEDRALLQDRMATWLKVGREQDVAAHSAAAIGFCFGGLCVLDLARTGADVEGVVSFHGLFGAPDTGKADTIPAKVLLLHGWDDPMAQPDSVVAVTQELTEAKADWRLHAYGGVMHAFTNPKADDPDFGTVYDAKADRLSRAAMADFLNEVF